MIEHRPFAALGHADYGWLDARYHFSFANYHNPDRMGWGALRVWNDDAVAAGRGFPAHPHRDMEIITFVRQGAITHKDSLGNEGRTGAGDVQVMSAGTGVSHSEYNLEDETTRLFQLWILPREQGAAPSWGAKPFPRDDRSGKFVALASGFETDTEALRIRADARVLGATLKAGESATYTLAPNRHAYLVASKGAAAVHGGASGTRLGERDGAAITGESKLHIAALGDAELILVDSD